MNRIERDKQRARMKKQIDDIIRNNPEYARRHKEEQEENVMQAFRIFILIKRGLSRKILRIWQETHQQVS